MGSNFFQRDQRDAKFLLFDYLDIDRILNYEQYQHLDRSDLKLILDEAFKLCQEVVGPTNQDGDRIGCSLEQGKVLLPPSFKECWRVMAENGWMALPHSQDYGGQGLPAVMAGLVTEYISGANIALNIYKGLTAAAGHVIETFGREVEKKLFCPKMYSGLWAGTMAMTEPDVGSDVGWLRTKAVPVTEAGDERLYKIEGVKRFISGGDHDLTENIIHLVLARIEGAPPGSRGVSLFIVPKIRVHPDGSLGQPNDVVCSGLEEKMGIHGSATCTLNFGENGGCQGILLGGAEKGLAQMFQMMNEARIGCGTLALGLAASAYDTASRYAKERIQGPPFVDRSADRVPIIKHEDVRRMLMNLKSGTEAMRAMLVHLFYQIDVFRYDPDEEIRRQARQQVELFTPLAKAYCSDFGYELTREAIQIMGGVGYCREFPVEQYARDMKCISIYEGTSYIQALDLVGRKLGLEGGRVFQDFIKEDVMGFADAHKEDPDFGPDFKLLFKAAQATGDYAQRYWRYFTENRLQLIALSATRFLDCFAETLMARLMLEQGLVARDRLQSIEPDSGRGIFYRGKMASAGYFCRNILTNVFGRHESLQLEDTSALDIPEEAF